MKRNELDLIDGGSDYINTLLARRGQKLEKTRLWMSQALFSNIEAVEEYYREFLKAGCSTVSTITYQLSPEQLGEDGLVEAYKKNMDCLARVRKDFPNMKVLLSFGSYAALMPNMKEYEYKFSKEELEKVKHCHVARFDSFLKANGGSFEGIDMLGFETIPDYEEAILVSEILKDVKYAEKIGDRTKTMSFSRPFDKKLDRPLENMRRFVEFISKDPSDSACWFVGMNCLDPLEIQKIIHILDEDRLLNAWPRYILYPDGREISLDDWVYTATEIYHRLAIRDRRILIGGCCHTTPVHISKLYLALESMNCDRRNDLIERAGNGRNPESTRNCG